MDQLAFWIQLGFFTIAGMAVGSFLNVCMDRLPAGASIVAPQSACDVCHQRLGVLDLVPVFSYLWLRGRCRYSQTPIPRRILVVELFTGTVFAYIAAAYSTTLFPQGTVLFLYASLLIAIFFIDLEHQLILNKVVYPSLPIALALAPWGPPGWSTSGLDAYLLALQGGGFALVLFLVLFLAARGGMGAGDVKLGLLLGLMLGLPLTVLGLMLGFVAGGVAAILLVVIRRKGMKSAVPFAPFLTGGAIVTIFWGTPLLEWYP